MTQTFTDFLTTIFGTYTPIEIIDQSGAIVDTCVDFGYIMSVIVLLVFVWAVLKTIGGLVYEWCRK